MCLKMTWKWLTELGIHQFLAPSRLPAITQTCRNAGIPSNGLDEPSAATCPRGNQMASKPCMVWMGPRARDQIAASEKQASRGDPAIPEWDPRSGDQIFPGVSPGELSTRSTHQS